MRHFLAGAAAIPGTSIMCMKASRRCGLQHSTVTQAIVLTLRASTTAADTGVQLPRESPHSWLSLPVLSALWLLEQVVKLCQL